MVLMGTNDEGVEASPGAGAGGCAPPAGAGGGFWACCGEAPGDAGRPVGGIFVATIFTVAAAWPAVASAAMLRHTLSTAASPSSTSVTTTHLNLLLGIGLGARSANGSSEVKGSVSRYFIVVFVWARTLYV